MNEWSKVACRKSHCEKSAELQYGCGKCDRQMNVIGSLFHSLKVIDELYHYFENHA